MTYTGDSLLKLSDMSQHLFYMLANLTVYINHACNFFFYVFLNKPFRSFLWHKVRKSSPSDAHGTRLSSFRTDSVMVRKLATDAHAIINLLQHRAELLPTEPVTESEDNLKTDHV